MGNLLQPSCACGYLGDSIRQGFGFSYMQTGIVYEPVYCNACGLVETTEAHRPSPTCSSCNKPVSFYRPPAPPPLTITGFPDSSRLDEESHWHCPACKQETLHFKIIGMWD